MAMSTLPAAGVERAASDADSTRATPALLERLAPEMLRVCRGIVGVADAEDAAQESLIRLVRALPSFRGEGSLRGFALRIAIRTAMRQLSRRKPSADPIEDEAELGAARSGMEPEGGYLLARRRAYVRELLDQLPPEQAETLALRFMLGHSLKEIGELTQTPVNTVRSRMRLARTALRKRIESDPRHRELLELDDG